ncbi:MAG: signal peptidase II [Proteobacteria bacterium]|nr:signal peptidase II [Pseudomonadota bacterium]
MSRAAYFVGPHTGIGLGAAVATAAIDQAAKLWLLFVFDLAARGRVTITPFMDLVLVWNTGISYGLFQQDTVLGQWGLLAVKIVAVTLLWMWLARAGSALCALALGLIIGGGLGNGIDRLAHGAVADYVLLHVTAAGMDLRWYVFNIADAGVVVGVALLLYDSVFGGDAAKAP